MFPTLDFPYEPDVVLWLNSCDSSLKDEVRPHRKLRTDWSGPTELNGVLGTGISIRQVPTELNGV